MKKPSQGQTTDLDWILRYQQSQADWRRYSEAMVQILNAEAKAHGLNRHYLKRLPEHLARQPLKPVFGIPAADLELLQQMLGEHLKTKAPGEWQPAYETARQGRTQALERISLEFGTGIAKEARIFHARHPDTDPEELKLQIQIICLEGLVSYDPLHATAAKPWTFLGSFIQRELGVWLNEQLRQRAGLSVRDAEDIRKYRRFKDKGLTPEALAETLGWTLGHLLEIQQADFATSSIRSLDASLNDSGWHLQETLSSEDNASGQLLQHEHKRDMAALVARVLTDQEQRIYHLLEDDLSLSAYALGVLEDELNLKPAELQALRAAVIHKLRGNPELLDDLQA